MTHQPERVSPEVVYEDHGVKDIYELSQMCDRSNTGAYPALCEDGCMVEPDGECQHGHPSVLVDAGLI